MVRRSRASYLQVQHVRPMHPWKPQSSVIFLFTQPPSNHYHPPPPLFAMVSASRAACTAAGTLCTRTAAAPSAMARALATEVPRSRLAGSGSSQICRMGAVE